MGSERVARYRYLIIPDVIRSPGEHCVNLVGAEFISAQVQGRDELDRYQGWSLNELKVVRVGALDTLASSHIVIGANRAAPLERP